MCLKEIISYIMCGCLDKVAHIRTCADRLLKDDFGNGYGYSRCPIADHEPMTLEAAMPGSCPRCALNNLVVVNGQLVPMSGTMKKITPLTRLPPKEKNDEVKKGKDGQVSFPSYLCLEGNC